MNRHLIELRARVLFSSDGAQGQMPYVQGKWRSCQGHKGRVSSKEWIIGLSFVHSQEQAEGIPFLYCLWDVGVDRMAFCGESNRQGPALARDKPASHSCQSQNSWLCAGESGNGCFPWTPSSLQSGSMQVKSPTPWCWFLTKYTSDPARPLL